MLRQSDSGLAPRPRSRRRCAVAHQAGQVLIPCVARWGWLRFPRAMARQTVLVLRIEGMAQVRSSHGQNRGS